MEAPQNINGSIYYFEHFFSRTTNARINPINDTIAAIIIVPLNPIIKRSVGNSEKDIIPFSVEVNIVNIAANIAVPSTPPM